MIKEIFINFKEKWMPYWDKMKQIIVPELRLLPGHLTLFFVLSLIPIMILISYTSTYFKFPIIDILESLKGILPTYVFDILIPYTERGLTLHSGVWMVFAFILASNGMHAVVVCSDTLFGFKHRNYFIRRLKALLLTILLVIIIIFNLLVFSYSRIILHFNLFQGINEITKLLLGVLRWPVILLFLFCMIKIVYMFTPRYRIPGKYSNIGALFTSILWVISTFAYSYYLNNSNNQYSDLYGDFASVIVLIMWMYILSYVFTLGISINAYHYRIKQSKVNT